MVKTDTFELRVVLENGAYFSYQNPSDTVCIQFSGCTNWKAAKSVLWRNLPAQWSVDFYQREGCLASNGDVYYWTGKEAGDGLYKFKTPRAIKSIYARPLWGNIPWNVARKCVQLRQPAKRAESSLLSNETSSSICDEVNGTERTEVGSNVEEGISSNWFDPIEIEDAATNSGSAEKEWKAVADVFMSG
ncbi:hypothetical protein PRIC1_003979 [Phytophthora ramorum]